MVSSWFENRPWLPRPMPVASTVEGSNTIDAFSRVPAPVTSYSPASSLSSRGSGSWRGIRRRSASLRWPAS